MDANGSLGTVGKAVGGLLFLLPGGEGMGMLGMAMRFAFSQRESRLNGGTANHISDHAPDGVPVVRQPGEYSGPQTRVG